MMSSRLRLLLVVLLLAALPLRTFAASAMLFCAAGHEAPAAGMHDPGPQHSTAPDHDAHIAGGHAMHDANDANDASDEAGPGLHAGHGCSVCGACCTGVANGPAIVQWVPHAPSALPIPFAPPHYAGVDLARDNRPPVS